jgi:hypothetical protein
MKMPRQKVNWIVDAALLIGFLVASLLDLTGLALHQWLGAAVAVIAGYHVSMHWTWVKSVTARFFKPMPAQARIYYLMDAVIVIGFVVIILTGLAISTWLSLTLANYEAWRVVHIAATIITTSLVIVKIALHWRWIVTVAQRYILPTPPAPIVNVLRPVPAAVADRRAFLRMIAIVGAAAVLPMSKALAALGAGAPAPGQEQNTGIALAVQTAVVEQTTAQSSTASNTTSATATPASTATPVTVKSVTTSTSTAPTAACTVRCDKGCSYPGRCRRYVDSNKNNRCDLGECL